MKKNEIIEFAKYFNKTNGVYTYSGEMAIELSLFSINVKNKKVVIQNNVCHRILLAVLRSGAIPIIIRPSNMFCLSKIDIDNVLKVHKDIAVIIAVHQHGIRTNIKEIRDAVGKRVVIIEDIAQGWDVGNIGEYSDYVVTSFGKSKQLSFGIGGAVFTSNNNINNFVDVDYRISRQTDYLVLPYMLPNNIIIKFKKMKKIADKNIRKQIQISKKVKKIINKKYKDFECLNIDKGVWNKFPIWTESYDKYEELINLFKEKNIKFELLSKKQLEEVEFLKNYKYFFYDFQKENKYIILIKTKGIRRGDLIKWAMS